MTEIVSTHGVQLALALLAALAVFVGAYALPERAVVALLVLLIPFQIISSKYGTLNVAMTWLAFAAFVLQGRIRELPYLGAVLAIAFAYLLSMSLAIPSTYMMQGLYLVNVFSSFALFYLIYNHLRRQPDAAFAIWLLVWMNVLVLVYSLAQIGIGFRSVTLFGLEEWTVSAGNAVKRRLLGPFGPAGINASYLMLQILLLGWAFMRLGTGPIGKALIAVLVVGDFGLLVATGSRGGLLALVAGALIGLVFFRRQLGLLRMAAVMSWGIAGMAVATLLIVTFTPFDQVFGRLAGTQFEGIVPDSRRGWFEVIRRIPEALVFGHGPRIVFDDMSPRFLREVFIGFPHNLYLFLLYSLGVVGFVAWMTWFATLALHWWGVARREVAQTLEAELPRVGVVLLLAFLVDEMKIEFLRFQVIDFQHYVFTLWAVVAAFAMSARERGRVAAEQG